MKTFTTGSNRALRTTSVLGRGGEGTVFNIEGQPDLAAKIYTDGKHLARRDKIAAMVANELHKTSPLVAFPIETLKGDGGDFIGFTMRKVSGVRPVHELYAPGSRKVQFPKADYRFLVRTALNVARAIASVHQSGCVVGDINHSGMLISSGATVTLIDADSFQVRAGTAVYRCLVGTGDYTPPELQGAKLDRVDREPVHDAFGLAVIVFQLLFMGRHPFAGRFSGQGDMPIERAIKEGRFAYSSRKNETRMEPPPFVPTLGDVPPEVASAFERAFAADPSMFRSRPVAKEWVSLLTKFEADLIPCRINPSHHHPKNARGCQWCRLENGTGVTLFPMPDMAVGSNARANFDLTAAIAAIERVVEPGPAPEPALHFKLSAPAARSAHAIDVRRSRLVGRIAGAMIAAISIAIAFNGVPLGLAGLLITGFLFFGRNEGIEQLRAATIKAEGEWKFAAQEWAAEAGNASFLRKREELRNIGKEYQTLSSLEKRQIDDLDSRRAEIQLRRFLEGHPIDRAKIAGIGGGRKSTLASYGIENAFDVTARAIAAVPGFGPSLTSNLLTWRETVQRRFVFNPSLGTDPAAIRQVKDAIARRRNDIEQALRRGPIELEQIRNHAFSIRSKPTQRLVEAFRAMTQAKADFS